MCKIVEWTCYARPAETTKTCFHPNQVKEKPGRIGKGLFCDKCGCGLGASKRRVEKGDIDSKQEKET